MDALGLQHAIVGGLAVSIWGPPRATADVDLYAELPLKRRAEIRREMVRRGFDVPAMDEELERFGVFRSLFRPTGRSSDQSEGFPAGTAPHPSANATPASEHERTLRTYHERVRPRTFSTNGSIAASAGCSGPALDAEKLHLRVQNGRSLGQAITNPIIVIEGAGAGFAQYEIPGTRPGPPMLSP